MGNGSGSPIRVIRTGLWALVVAATGVGVAALSSTPSQAIEARRGYAAAANCWL